MNNFVQKQNAVRCRKPGNLPPKGDGYAPHNAAQAGLFLCLGLI
jgi:hypothetical protein